jgi:hypothetical protein
VRIAKKKVESFWSERLPERQEKAEIKKPLPSDIKPTVSDQLEI